MLLENLRLYRLYHIGSGGGIESVSIVEAAEDTVAIARARELLQTADGELWLDDSMVAIVQRVVSGTSDH